MSSEVEIIEHKFEKRKLCFDKEEKVYIELDIDLNTTCQNIYDENKEKIEQIIKSLNTNLPKNFDLDMELNDGNFYFCLIQPIKDKEKVMLSSAIDFKFHLNEKIYKIILNNMNSILCFLPKNNSKKNLRKNARSLFVLEKDIYEDTQDSKLKDNTIKDFTEEILFKNTIFLYEKKNQNFIKKDIVIDFEKIAITKDNIFISISKIKKFNFFYYNTDEFKKYYIKGDKMFGYIVIGINEEEPYLFAHKKEYYFKKLLYALKCAINNYEISILDMDIDNDIYSSKSSLFAIYHLIIDNCFLIKEILSNNEKRKIFVEFFPEKKIGEIIDQIIEYKYLNKKEQFLESWTNFKQILAYIEPYKDNNKNKEIMKKKENNENLDNKDKVIDELFNVLKKVNIDKYKQVLEESNAALQNTMIKTKKENEQNNNIPYNNNLQYNLNKVLKELLKDNLFDDLFFYLYNLYVLPFFESVNQELKRGESTNNKPSIRKKFQLLLALYYFKFFELKFNYLGDKDDIRTASMFYNK